MTSCKLLFEKCTDIFQNNVINKYKCQQNKIESNAEFWKSSIYNRLKIEEQLRNAVVPLEKM